MPEFQVVELAGRRLGDYQLIRRLGRGGMADVYLADQTSLKRMVALKILRSELSTDANYVRRFRNEARAAAALIHPNIVQIYEVGEIDGHQFIAQEYVPGMTLKQRLERQGVLDATEAISILRQAAAALRKSQQFGIVHRDIKPENLLLDDDGVLKIADYGLARQGTDPTALGLTTDGMTMGTPLYMSPEQVQGQVVDIRSDIYSLGVTAFELLSGHLPFDGDTPLSVALKHVSAEAPDLHKLQPTLPAALCQLVQRMLKKAAAERCSLPELIEALQQLDAAQGNSSGLSAAVSASLQRATKASSVMDATHRLQLALRSGEGRVKKGLDWRLPAVLLAAALLGGFLARLFVPGDPLANIEAPAVPRKESPTSQYAYASMVNTEEAWRAVQEYYPEDGNEGERQRYYALLSRLQLGRWYADKDLNAPAIGMFESLLSLGVQYQEIQAAAAAELALTYRRIGDESKSAEFAAEFVNRDRRDRLDTETRRKIESLINSAQNIGRPNGP